MLSSPRLSLASLIELCRALRHSLGAGLPMAKVFAQQARSGPTEARTLAEHVQRDLEQGESLETALKQHEATLPPLFLALATVGERAGQLPAIFGELESYFLLRQRLRRQLRAQSIRPLFQFVIAVVIIAFLIWVLGVIADMHNTPPLDPLGLGLVGGRGALLFAALALGIPAACLGLCLLARNAGRLAALEAWLLRLPLLGPCLQALALMRFCLALRLTQEAGMLPADALALSLRATDNAAFAAAVPPVQQAVRSGQELTRALAPTGLLPEEFMQVLAVAEETGQVPEVMRRQAEHYRDEAERRMKMLTRVAGYLIWLLTATFIVWAIFRIFINAYLSPMQGF